MKNHRVIRGFAIGAAVGFAVLATLFLVSNLRPRSSPEQVSEAFFLETYTRDFSAAWERVSGPDQAARSKDAYLAANPPANDLQAALYDQLAEWGDFQALAVVSRAPTEAIVSAHIRFPINGHTRFRELVDAAAQPSANRTALLQELSNLHNSGQLQFFESDVSFDLVLEANQWRIVQHWGQSITVQLEAMVSPSLPWDFYPVQDEIAALPGELVRATYFARNHSDEAITGKAIHEVGPAAAAPYFQTIECFCFTEQTLEPGEEREMTLLFRIDFSAPSELESIANRYTFYTLGDFPSEG